MAESHMERSISRIEMKLDALRADLNAAKVSDAAIHAEQYEQIRSLSIRADGVHRKLKDHEDNHLKYVLGTTGVVGVIMAAARWIQP